MLPQPTLNKKFYIINKGIWMKNYVFDLHVFSDAFMHAMKPDEKNA